MYDLKTTKRNKNLQEEFDEYLVNNYYNHDELNEADKMKNEEARKRKIQQLIDERIQRKERK